MQVDEECSTAKAMLAHKEKAVATAVCGVQAAASHLDQVTYFCMSTDHRMPILAYDEMTSQLALQSVRCAALPAQSRCSMPNDAQKPEHCSMGVLIKQHCICMLVNGRIQTFLSILLKLIGIERDYSKHLSCLICR